MKEEGFYGLEKETWLCDYSQKITEVDKKKSVFSDWNVALSKSIPIILSPPDNSLAIYESLWYRRFP